MATYTRPGSLNDLKICCFFALFGLLTAGFLGLMGATTALESDTVQIATALAD